MKCKKMVKATILWGTYHKNMKRLKLNYLKKGFNVEGIFDAEITTASKLQSKEAEDEQVKALVDRKEGFLESSIYTNIGTMRVTSSTVLKAQRRQLKHEESIKADKA